MAYCAKTQPSSTRSTVEPKEPTESLAAFDRTASSKLIRSPEGPWRSLGGQERALEEPAPFGFGRVMIGYVPRYLPDRKPEGRASGRAAERRRRSFLRAMGSIVETVARPLGTPDVRASPGIDRASRIWLITGKDSEKGRTGAGGRTATSAPRSNKRDFPRSRDIREPNALRPRRRPDLHEAEPPHSATENHGAFWRGNRRTLAVSGSMSHGHSPQTPGICGSLCGSPRALRGDTYECRVGGGASRTRTLSTSSRLHRAHVEVRQRSRVGSLGPAPALDTLSSDASSDRRELQAGLLRLGTPCSTPRDQSAGRELSPREARSGGPDRLLPRGEAEPR
jgi:hypothetical protein